MTQKLLTTVTLFVCAGIAQLAMSGAQLPTTSNSAATEIHGTVTDPSGAVIPGAMVTVSNGPYGRTVSTDEAGQFTVTGLGAGHYRVRVHFGGFAVFDRANYVVTEGRETEANAQLELKETRQAVTVYE